MCLEARAEDRDVIPLHAQKLTVWRESVGFHYDDILGSPLLSLFGDSRTQAGACSALTGARG